MRKCWIGALALAMSVVLLSGCSDGTGTAKSDEGSAGESLDQESPSGQFKASDYVTLGEYKGLQVNVALPEEYDEAAVEIQTKQLYFSYVTAEEGITDRPVELLDMTNIDYEGKKDGVAFEGGTAKGANLLIGSGQFIDGFEDGLIGVMPGETVDLNLTFPENYGSEELAGQDVVFTVTVNYIPQMEDASVEGIGIADVKTVDELRAYVDRSLKEKAQSAYQAEVQNAVMEQIIGTSTFEEFPADLLNENREICAQILDREASNYGVDAQSYVGMFGMDYESVLDERTEWYTQMLLVMHAIAEKENMKISDSDLDARLEETAKAMNVTVDGLMVNGLTREDYRDSFLQEEVLKYLVDNVVNTADNT